MRRRPSSRSGTWLIAALLAGAAGIAVLAYAWATTMSRLPRLLVQGPAIVVLVLVAIALVLLLVVALKRPPSPRFGHDLPGLRSTFTIRRSGIVVGEHATDAREVVLGSAPSCDLQLAGAGIRKRHAIVRKRSPDRIELEPVGGALVRVNGERIAGCHQIRIADVLQLGDVEITMRLDARPDDTSLN